MKIQSALVGTCVMALILSSCTSMESSKVDRKMKFLGSFSCSQTSEEKNTKETLAEADQARIRCAKDEWKLSQDEIIFTRTLFQTRNCETALGQIKFTENLRSQGDTLSTGHPHCKLIRINPSWLGEESGKCMVKDLKLNAPYSLASVYACKGYVPAFCSSQSVKIESQTIPKESHEPYDELRFTGEPSGHSITCKRYAAE